MLKPLVPQLTEDEKRQARELDKKLGLDLTPSRLHKHYDVDGTPITFGEWAYAFEGRGRDRRFRHVGDTTLPNGLWVSTVWLGLNHSWDPNGPPLIFETMVFKPKPDGGDVDQERYASLMDAEIGHMMMVEKWRDWVPVMEEDAFKKAITPTLISEDDFKKAMDE